MSPSCPISQRRIDTNFVRVVSFQVFLLTLLFAVTRNDVFIFVVLYDFAARVLRKERYSPFAQIAKFVLKRWKAVPCYSDESPKRFALYLGFMISLAIMFFSLLGFVKTALFVAFLLIFCVILEVLFDFCIGCKLYYVLQLIKVIKHDRNFN